MSNARLGMGDDRKEQLRSVLREVVAGVVSDMLLKRLDAVIEDAGGDALDAASERVTRMVALFVGAKEASVVSERFQRILGGA